MFLLLTHFSPSPWLHYSGLLERQIMMAVKTCWEEDVHFTEDRKQSSRKGQGKNPPEGLSSVPYFVLLCPIFHSSTPSQ